MAGSIQKRGENTYLLTVSNKKDANGDRQRFTKTITAQSDAEAKKELTLFYADVKRGQVKDDKKYTLQEYSKFWLEKKRNGKKSPKTLSRYEELLARINFAIGHIRLSKLKPRHLVDFYDMLRQDGVRLDGKKGGLSEQTIAHYHRLLHAILRTAVKVDELIPKNPAEDLIDPPTFPKSKAKFYEDHNVVALLQALKKAAIKYRVFVILTIFVGNRRGEALGLEWPDIDEEKCIIHIRRASYYTKKTGIYESTPKTDESVRDVVVPSQVIDMLKSYKAWWNKKKLKKGSKWEDTDRLFVQHNGKPMHPDTPSKWFKKFIEANGFDPITLHQLRHTNASLLIAAGVDLVTVSERLGHADKSTTTRIYAHMQKKNNEKAADVLADSLIKMPL